MHKKNPKVNPKSDKNTKAVFRKKVSDLRNQFSREELKRMSNEVFSVLEITGVFQSAKNVFIYNNLTDEVSTSAFISKWSSEKNFFVPVVCEDKLVFRACQEDENCTTSALGIKEPCGNDFTAYKSIDLVIIPGVAFDRRMNRLGRGKGYYDKFLSDMKATKIGVCFDFQLFDTIPSDNHDIKMDMIISENDLIW